MSYLFRLYNISDQEVIGRTNRLIQRAYDIPALTSHSVAIPAASFEITMRVLGKEFGYEDIFKRSGISDRELYRRILHILCAHTKQSYIPCVENIIKKYSLGRYASSITSLLSNYKECKRREYDASLNLVSQFSPVLPLAAAYIIARNNRCTVERDQICDDYSLEKSFFDDLIKRIEDALPDYNLWIGYRELEEERTEKQKQQKLEREIRSAVIDGKTPETHGNEKVVKAIEKATEYKQWRDKVLTEKRPVSSKKTTSKQLSISSLFSKKKSTD